jgi:hypothetical protein
LKTRQQGKRLLYILKAPQLKTRPEWLTQIPDLSGIEDANGKSKQASYQPTSTRPARPRPQPQPEPIDLSQVNTQDNGFIWVALGAIGFLLGGLLWLSQQ